MSHQQKGYLLATLFMILILVVLGATFGFDLRPVQTEAAQPLIHPPVISHTLEGRAGNCLLCHKEAAEITPPKTPHPERTNCQQCHVPQAEQPEVKEK